MKLLRILQEREFERLGSNTTRHIDVRVVAATNQDLRAALEQGTFREDLYYRLNVVPINIPPLRERKQDIPFLANHFVKKLAPDTGSRAESITDAAMEKLVDYHWPGNVRELENVIERSLVMAAGTQLDAADIKLESGAASARAERRAGFPAGGHDARRVRAGDHPRSAAPRRRQQEPGGAAAGVDAQRAALPTDADGTGELMLTDRESYKALERHYQEIRPLHLRALFADDPRAPAVSPPRARDCTWTTPSTASPERRWDA